MRVVIGCPDGGEYPVEARDAPVLVMEDGPALVESNAAPWTSAPSAIGSSSSCSLFAGLAAPPRRMATETAPALRPTSRERRAPSGP
jgi:hypothetical protein